MYDIVELNTKLVAELRQIAQGLNIPKTEKLLKKDLIYKILDHQALNPTKEMLDKETRKVNTGPRKKPVKPDHKPSPKSTEGTEKKATENHKKRGRPRKKPEVAASSLPGKD